MRASVFESSVDQHVESLRGQRQVQRAPLFSAEPEEPVGRYSDWAGAISTGDLALFTGCKPHSWAIRIATWSQFSHCGMFLRDEEGLWIVDVCEGVGGSKRFAQHEVEMWPGRWHWAHIARGRYPWFNEQKAARVMLDSVGCKYGYAGIVLQGAIHMPILRELAYATSLDRWHYFLNQPPFCSHAVKGWTVAAGEDAVPDRPGFLVTPQDLAQSKLWSRHKLALVPDDFKVSA